MAPDVKKPRIRQAGSAEAFVGSDAAGIERLSNRPTPEKIQEMFFPQIQTNGGIV
jgi:hypothetical protein